MKSGPLPPRWLERIAFPASPRGELLYLLGDLREEYAERHQRQGPLRASLWFVGQAAACRYRLSISRLGTRPRVDGSSQPLSSVISDAARSVRLVFRRPGFALLMALTTAAGVAGTAVTMAGLYSVLVTPLPWSDPDRVFMVETKLGDLAWSGSSIPEFRDIEGGMAAFEQVAGYGYAVSMIGDSTNASRLSGLLVTGDLFSLLGAEPTMGRGFTPQDAIPGAEPVVLLGHETWQRDFGGDPGIVGRVVSLSGVPTTVVGVMGRDFAFPNREISIWEPWRLDLENPQASRANHFLRVVGRLRADVEVDVARAQLESVASDMTQTFPDSYSNGIALRMRPYLDVVLAGAGAPIRLLALAGFLLFTVSAVNVTMLVANRRDGRAKDAQLRLALGAGRIRASIPSAVEAWLGILSGGAVGIAIASIVLGAIRDAAPPEIPRVELLALNPWLIGVLVVAAAVVAAIATGASLGWSEGPDGLGRAVRGDRGATPMLRRGETLVVTQIALAMTLCCGAGLMVRSLQSLYAVELGVQPEGVLTARVTLRGDGFREAEERIAGFRSIRDELLRQPGVREVGGALNLPYGGRYGSDWTFQTEETQSLGIGESPVATVQMAGPGYFEAAGITVEGRTFTDADVADGVFVGIVNRTMAERHWPGRSALGQRFRVWNDPAKPWMEVVGVADDVRSFGVDRAAAPIYYVPTTQAHVSTYFTPREMFMLVRTELDPAALSGSLRGAVGAAVGSATVSSVRPMTDVIASGHGQRTLTLQVLSAFAGVALFLAGIGVFASMLTGVTRRRSEIGIRRALGETAGTIVRELVQRALVIALAGAVIGVALSLAGTRLLAALLFGVDAWDPAALVGAAGVLVAVSLAATLIPSLRALSISPIEALQSER